MNSLFSCILSVVNYFCWDLCFNYCIFSGLEFVCFFFLFLVLPLPFLIALTLGWNSQCCSTCLFSTYFHVISSWTRPCFFVFFVFFNFFIYLYLFLAVLGLRFCARAFSSCSERGPLFIAVRGPLTIVASLVAEHRLQTRRLSSCGSRA